MTKKQLLERLLEDLGESVDSLAVDLSHLRRAVAELDEAEYNTAKAPSKAWLNDANLLKEWVNIAAGFVNIQMCERCGHLYADGYTFGNCDCEDEEDRIEGECIYGDELLWVLNTKGE